MKDIKDYLHFYLGCEIYADGFQVRKLTPLVLMEYSEHYYQYKLILRPLSDMTEEEAKKYGLSYWGGGINIMFCFHVDQVRLLLKDGWDLYNLINDGIAIDKSKLPTNERR